MYTNYRQRDFFWGFLVGSAIATLSTLLFTTKKGKQIRQQVSDTCENIKDSISDTLSEAEEKIEEPIEQVGKKLAHKVKKEDPFKGPK